MPDPGGVCKAVLFDPTIQMQARYPSEYGEA